MYKNPIIKTLIVSSLLISNTGFAESCEQKWAKYYAGKSWFKPWCDTESYKRRMAEDSYYDDYYDEKETKITRHDKNKMRSRRVTFSNPKYMIPESCKPDPRSKDYVPNSCIDLFGDVTFIAPKDKNDPSADKTEINSAVFRC